LQTLLLRIEETSYDTFLDLWERLHRLTNQSVLQGLHETYSNTPSMDEVMTRQLAHRICDRCGDTLTNYCPTVEALSAIGAFHEQGEQAVVDEIVRREGVDPAIIWEYFQHRMISICKQKIAHCSFCGGQLRTWKARQCMHCLKDWH